MLWKNKEAPVQLIIQTIKQMLVLIWNKFIQTRAFATIISRFGEKCTRQWFCLSLVSILIALILSDMNSFHSREFYRGPAFDTTNTVMLDSNLSFRNSKVIIRFSR